MPRERTTWNREDVIAKAAALAKRADPYAMNQPEHLKAQKPAEAYMNGSPSEWAEDLHPSKDWKVEYDGQGQTKRNEIGMPEMRPETFNHAEKTASEAAVDKKAAVCVTLARRVLPKTASDQIVEDQAYAFMHMPDQMLVETYTRLAADEEEKQEGQEKQAQAQDDKKDQAQEKQAQAQDEKKDQGQEKQAQQAQDEKKDEGQKQAQAQDQGEKKDQGQEKQAQQDEKKDQGQEQKQANGQQQMLSAEQVQSMVQQAVQAAMQQMQQMAGQQQQQQAAQQQQAVQQQQAATYSDDQLLDQMLAEPQGGDVMAEMGIQMDAPMMDVEATLGEEDSALKMLFANEESQAQEQMQQGQEKQAAVRTASTRTVGTRPSAGVSRLGGAGSPAAKPSDVDQLSSLWKSDPDVSEVFGIRR
jgi:hypothetical protein